MSFIWPQLLASLLLIPVGVWAYGAIGRRRARRFARAYGRAATSAGSIDRRGRAARVIPAGLLVAGFALMGVALARPQAVVSLPKQEGIVILAFDVSDSMAATDITPTRIEAAKAAARDFVANQPSGISIGVVAFSDSGVSVQTPTTDQGVVLDAIARLTPQKGTSVAAGINASLEAIAAAERGPYANNYYSNRSPSPTPTATPVPAGYHAPASIVLLSDGENNENPDPMTAAQAAANAGVRIFTVGLGSTAGTILDVGGFRVHTQLYPDALQAISAATGGTYFAATDAASLRSIYSNLNTQIVTTPELTELTAIFAGLAVLLLLGGAGASLISAGRMP